jgi:hypothetical protein
MRLHHPVPIDAGLPQHAFQLFAWLFGGGRRRPDLWRSAWLSELRTALDGGERNQTATMPTGSPEQGSYSYFFDNLAP